MNEERVAYYEWITVPADPAATDNQHPNWPSPLFRTWVDSGWEIVSVCVLHPTSTLHMCRAVGVLRRAVMPAAPPSAEGSQK